MRSRFAVLAVLLSLALLPVPVTLGGEEAHDHTGMGPPEKLGTVHFPVAGGPEIQRDFDRAVALLHSFQYEEAEKAFTRLARDDPKFAMAYWGIAMCNYHPIWGATTRADFERGRAAAERAARLDATDGRERDFIQAIGAYYRNSNGQDSSPGRVAYERAMEQLHGRHPDDLEGTIFYALAILGNAPANDRTYARQKQAAALLNAVLPKAPDHPGVAHYLIHSLDYPDLATLALPAARAYAKIAPSSPHAQHMPSHVFTRLGLWDESIRSNLASREAARQLMARLHPGATHFDGLHAMDYLEYAYLQLGDESSAEQVVKEMRDVARVDQAVFSAAYAFAATPARYALERHRWGEAEELAVSPAWFPWKDFPWAEAVTHFARGMGAARSGHLEKAREELQRLAGIRDQIKGAAGYDWADQVEVQRLSVQGWIARAEKRDGEALALLRSAADLEDSIDKHPVTPGAVLPAREQLADLLLETGRPGEAAREYETVLGGSPGRRNSLRGLEAARHAAAGQDRK